MPELTLIKQWFVSSLCDENDDAYIRDLGCEYVVHSTSERVEVTGADGNRYYIIDNTVRPGMYITTKTEREESLLMLKYAGDITLLRQFWANEWERYELKPHL
jgi:hypothetical protein